MADDSLFLQQLSEFLLEEYGNVNVCQRLNILAIKVGQADVRKVIGGEK